MFSSEQSKEVFEKTNGRCYYCGAYLVPFSDEKERYGRTFVVDHFTPKCAGGSNDIENLVPCCWACNSSKGGKDVNDWRWYMTRREFGIPKFNDEQMEYLNNFDIFEKIKWHSFYFESMEFLIDIGYTTPEILARGMEHVDYEWWK